LNVPQALSLFVLVKVTWLAPTGDSATVLDGPAPPHGWSGLTFRCWFT
jgi:hypothetical protein